MTKTLWIEQHEALLAKAKSVLKNAGCKVRVVGRWNDREVQIVGPDGYYQVAVWYPVDGRVRDIDMSDLCDVVKHVTGVDLWDHAPYRIKDGAVVVCAWCWPGDSIVRLSPWLKGKPISHSICKKCSTRVLNERHTRAVSKEDAEGASPVAM
jgi:hypothetical protein